MKNRPYQEASQDGFALAAVLWLMAGLSIVIALIADTTQASAERLAQLRERTTFVQSALSARANVQYWLSASRPRSSDFFDGAFFVRADNTPYNIDEQSTVSIQDNGGLVDLNRVERDTLGNFLAGCGVPTDRVSYLVDALLDYTDPDNLQRLNGAEQDTYSQQGLRPPRNSPLLSEEEVWNVYGWSQYRTLLERNACSKSFTVYGEPSTFGSTLNLATAPPAVLKAAGLGDEMIRDITLARSNTENLTDRVAQATELLGTGGLFGGSTPVQKTLKVTHRHIRGPWTLTYTLILDSDGEDRPWSVLNPVFSAELQPVDKITPLPWPQKPVNQQPSDATPSLPF